MSSDNEILRFRFNSLDTFHVPIGEETYFTIGKKERPMELKITAERVRAAAKTCGAADGALKMLFPEAFQAPSRSIETTKLRATVVSDRPAITSETDLGDFLIMTSGNYPDRLLLTSTFRGKPIVWSIEGIYLIPTLKD